MPPRAVGILLRQNESLARMEEARGRVTADAFWERRRRRGSAQLPDSPGSSGDIPLESGSDLDDDELHHSGAYSTEIMAHRLVERVEEGEEDALLPGSPSDDRTTHFAEKAKISAERDDPRNSSLKDLDQRSLEDADSSGRCSSTRGLPHLLKADEFIPGHSAMLLLPDTRLFLDINEHGQTDHRETTLKDIGSLDWRGRRDLIHKTLCDPNSDKWALGISLFIMTLILLSTTCYCLETMPQFQGNTVFPQIETVTIILFTIEYLLKLATTSPDKMLAFVRSPLNLIDVLAILPWYIEQLTPGNGGQGTAVLRIIRLARMFKLGGRYEKFGVVGKAMLTSVDVLGVLLFLMVISVVIFSTLIYYCEFPAPDNPNMVPQDFGSIPESFWWAMVTVNTVGYGDVVPLTDWGKIVGCCLMTVGLLIMALPISVIGTNFTQEWLDYKEFLSQQEAMKHLPENVRQFEDLLTEHVTNVEHITDRYSETEAELDYLRMKLQDKINQTKLAMAEEKLRLRQSQQKGGEDGEEDDGEEDEKRPGGFGKLFARQTSSKFKDRCSREMQEIKDLVVRIQGCSLYLHDLIQATEIFRMDGFEEDLKAVRMKYKQLEFIKEESHSLRQHLDEVETKARKVDPTIDCSAQKAFTRSDNRHMSFGEPLTNLQSSAWKKIKHYSRITNSMGGTLKNLMPDRSVSQMSDMSSGRSMSVMRHGKDETVIDVRRQSEPETTSKSYVDLSSQERAESAPLPSAARKAKTHTGSLEEAASAVLSSNPSLRGLELASVSGTSDSRTTDVQHQQEMSLPGELQLLHDDDRRDAAGIPAGNDSWSAASKAPPSSIRVSPNKSWNPGATRYSNNRNEDEGPDTPS